MLLFLERKSKHFPWYSFVIFFLLSGACASHKKILVRQQKVETVIHTAKTFVGTPYLYGGTSRRGMDCSALLISSFQAIDLDLPRTSRDQSRFGKEIKLKKLQPGDMVFFATGKRRRKVTHAGLVTEVEGRQDIKFIHASTSLGVIETNIFSDYYRKRFRVGRRVID